MKTTQTVPQMNVISSMIRTFNVITGAIFFTISVNAQSQSIPAPSDADALNHLKTDKKLHQLIKEQTGYTFSQVKVVKNYDWVKSYTDEGYWRSERWPYDKINKTYDIETPKDANGIYSQYQVFIDYRRSNCTMNGCLMTDTYTYMGASLGPQYQYGFKEFKKDEKMIFLTTYLKGNKPAEMNDVIQISMLETDESYTTNHTNAMQQVVYFKISGKLAIYSADYSRIFDVKEFNNKSLRLYLSNKNGVWSGDSIDFKDDYERAYFYRGYKEEELKKEYYEPFGLVGFEGVYQKTTQGSLKSGMYEQLQLRVNEVMNVIVARGDQITVNDLQPFIIPASLRDETDAEMNEMIAQEVAINPSATTIRLLSDFTYDSHYFSYDSYTDQSGKTIHLHNVKTFLEATIDGYKFSKGAKKGKPIATGKDSFDLKWGYDPATNNWYLLSLDLPSYN